MALQLEYRVLYTVMYGVNTLVFLYSAQYTYDHIVHFKMNFIFIVVFWATYGCSVRPNVCHCCLFG